MNQNLQPAKHPDADQLSVFVEGAATAKEQQGMLAHLAECADCRKAVFLMQPHEETHAAAPPPAKEWIWRRLLPVGLPAAALACGLIAVLVYMRPHGIAPHFPQQIAKVTQPEIERPGTTAAPATNLRSAPIANSEQTAQPRRRQNGPVPDASSTSVSRPQGSVGGRLSSPELKNEQGVRGVAPPSTGAAPSASVQTEDASLAQNTISSTTVSDLPLNGRNFTQLQLQPADKKAGASQDNLAKKKDLPALEIERAYGKAETLAGISGHITDRTGAVIAGAAVTLRDATGKTRETRTSADGSFHLTDLPTGQYELTATASGFKTNKQSIELKPSELAMLQPTLDVGAASEQVTVEAGAVLIQTETASVGRVIAVPSGLPIAATVSYGKVFLTLDSAGNLFRSHNAGKKWKKINPQWAGKAVRIELKPASISEASPTPKNQTLGPASSPAVFLLTTDANAVWTSKDGTHWHQQ